MNTNQHEYLVASLKTFSAPSINGAGAFLVPSFVSIRVHSWFNRKGQAA